MRDIKKILLSEVEQGMQIAKDIYDAKGILIVPCDTILDKAIIDKMKSYNVIVISIYNEDDEEQSLQKEIHDKKGYFEKLREDKNFVIVEETFKNSVSELRQSLNDIVAKNKITNIQTMLQGVNRVIESNKTGSSMLDVLNCMRGYDDLTYVHSMNVALICNVMAGWLKFNEEDKNLITLCGLLHDIGKVKIPKDIITKPDKLSDKEFQIIKMHPILGYNLLKDMPLDNRVKNAALMHHERYNGTGYPNGYAKEQIDDYAKIVAIADVYDAMTADRVYREGLCPFDVIEHFEKDLSIYDPRYILIFLQKTAESYISNKVLLSNGEEGIIAMINKTSISRPYVLIGDKGYDLSKENGVRIKKLL